MPRIYISALETQIDKRAMRLLDSLVGAGFILFWNKAWRPYQQIEREISECQALLAIVDSTWTSSTWMQSEVLCALGIYGDNATPNPLLAPIPVFLYPVGEAYMSAGRFPFDQPGTLTLQRNDQSAAEQILQVLEGK